MDIDSHQHFWQYDPAEHTWMSAEMPGLKRDLLPPDLKPLLDANGISGTVAVQARQSLAETEWLLALAAQYPFILGVVGWVDLQSPSVGEQLRRFAANPRLVGVRHVVQDEPDDQFMLRPAFLRGLEALGAFDLAYDLLLFPRHLPVAAQVVQQFPRQRFVLDHIAKPFIKAGRLAPWDEELRALAHFDNVTCKVSGMVTEAAWSQWTPEDFKPYMDVVFDAFGASRLMFGSDWPVCTLAAHYHEVVGLVRDYLQALPSDAGARVMGQNAIDAYHLAAQK
jgi:L-fuconolactonase